MDGILNEYRIIAKVAITIMLNLLPFVWRWPIENRIGKRNSQCPQKIWASKGLYFVAIIMSADSHATITHTVLSLPLRKIE